jgi:hypothetical protein
MTTPQPLLTLTDMVVAGPTQINPYITEAARVVEDYTEQLNIKLSNFRDYTTMISYLFPRTEPARLVVLNLIANLQWYVDDIYDRDSLMSEEDQHRRLNVFSTSLDVLNTGELPTDDEHLFYPVFKTLHDLSEPLSPGQWLQRFTDSMRDYFNVTTENLERMASNPLQTLENYIHMRELDSGMRPTIDMIEFAYNIYLPDEVIHHPYMAQMSARTSLIGALTNDLFSYEKEVLRVNSRFNILYILMNTYEMTFEQAVDATMQRLNGYITGFIESENAMPDWNNAALNRDARSYVQGLKDMIIATWHWQLSTNRYRSVHSPFAVLRQMLPE